MVVRVTVPSFALITETPTRLEELKPAPRGANGVAVLDRYVQLVLVFLFRLFLPGRLLDQEPFWQPRGRHWFSLVTGWVTGGPDGNRGYPA